MLKHSKLCTIYFSLNDTNSAEIDISNENSLFQNNETVVTDLMKLYLRHNLSKVAVEDIAKIINKVPGANIEIPTNKHLLFKEFLQNNPLNVFKYVNCSRCAEYSKFEFHTVVNDRLKCDTCATSLKPTDDFFVILDQLFVETSNN